MAGTPNWFYNYMLVLAMHQFSSMPNMLQFFSHSTRNSCLLPEKISGSKFETDDKFSRHMLKKKREERLKRRKGTKHKLCLGGISFFHPL